MDDSFTRSLYIGRDKAIEVARRREAVEKQLKERREAKIREQQERLTRAAQQKEQELKEKVRQRQERELQRQRAVIDRRCAQLEQDKAKKAEILQKAHNSASRPAQVNKKNAYAFGCSTPRVATYLDTPRHYITKEFSASSERLGDVRAAARGAAMRTPSRIMTGPSITTPKLRPSAAQPPSTMTRSVFGRLGNSRPSRPSDTTVSLTAGSGGGRRTANTSTNSSSSESAVSSAVIRRTTPSIMTQSLYEGKRGATPVRKSPPRAKATPTKPAAKPAARNATSNKSSLFSPARETVKDAAVEPSTVNRPPPIRPRKAIQTTNDFANEANVAPTIDKSVVSLTKELENVSLAVDSNDTQTDNIKQSAKHISIETIDGSAADVAEHSVEKWDEETPLESSAIKSAAESEFNSSTNSSTGNLLMVGRKEEWDSGHESNCANDAESAPTSVENKDDSSDALSLSTPKAGSVDETEKSTSQITTTLTEEAKVVEPAVVLQPAVITTAAVLDEKDKDRESRRQKLLEILQRTRNSGNLPTPNNSTASLSASAEIGGALPIRRPSSGAAIDATALAHDLLAQRRQKLQEMAAANMAPSTEARAPAATLDGSGVDRSAIFTLDTELNSVGFYDNNNGTAAPSVTTTSTYVSQHLSAVLSNGNNNNNNGSTNGRDEHFRENTLVRLPGEVLSRIDIIRQHKQTLQNDPEDPRMEQDGAAVEGGSSDTTLTASMAVVMEEVDKEEEDDEEYHINQPSLTNLYQINFVN